MQPSRPPKSALAPFVELLWASDGADERTASGRELVLPTGATHLAFRLGDRPLRVFRDGADLLGHTVGAAVIGGARADPYLRDVSSPGPGAGALLRPGAAELLFGAPADALSGVHTPLEDVWGARAVAELQERLSEATATVRLDLLEAALAARLPRSCSIDPLVAHALARFRAHRGVGEVARECGYSHRHFTNVFREAVGLKPKTYCRVLRFGRALDRLAVEPAVSWAELAAAEGYADQSHLSREFKAFAGVSPEDYRRRAPTSPRHVPA